MNDETRSPIEQARLALAEGRGADAKQHLLPALVLLRNEKPSAELAWALRNLGELERRSNGDEAVRYYHEAVAVYRELNEPLRLAHTIRHLGDVYHEGGRPDLAKPFYIEALKIYRSCEPAPPLDLANAIRSLAVLEGQAGEREEAVRLWQEAHDLYATCNVQEGVVESAARIKRLA